MISNRLKRIIIEPMLNKTIKKTVTRVTRNHIIPLVNKGIDYGFEKLLERNNLK